MMPLLLIFFSIQFARAEFGVTLFGMPRPIFPVDPVTIGNEVLEDTKILKNVYKKMLKPEAYDCDEGVDCTRGRNHGILSYNQKLLNNNACFSELVVSFYDSLKDKEKIGRKYRISDKAGSGELAKIDSGFLWNLAIQYSNNDPNLAMSLIGICGHDDKATDYWVKSKDPALKERTDKRINKLLQEIELRTTRLKLLRIQQVGLSGPELSSTLDDIKEQEKRKTQLIEELELARANIAQGKSFFECAHFESMYAPESLGVGVNIKENMIREITRIQAPNLGSSVLPAKYYHVIGAAMISCRAISEGVSKPLVVNGQKSLGLAYRGVSFCFKASQYSEDLKSILSQPNASDVLADEDEIDLVEKVAYAKLHDWYLKIDTSEVGKICTPIKKSGPVLLTPIDEETASNPCGKPISTDICTKARKKISTWMADFKWTEAQHEAGAKFAAEKCQRSVPENVNHDPTFSACAALNKQRGSGQQTSPPKVEVKRRIN